MLIGRAPSADPRDRQHTERRRLLMSGAVELVETCDCHGSSPCDFPACPRRPLSKEPNMLVITSAELRKLAPTADARIVTNVVTTADAAFAKWGITTSNRLHMLMAMTAVESAWFSKVFESMNYSPAGLRSTFPTHFTEAQAQEYGRTADHPANQAAIANLAYGGRMGNTGPDDGWLCRGQGLMQTTGLSSISRLAKALNVTVDECRAMLTADTTMMECAVATFVTWGCLPYADRCDVEGCTKVINGGLNGLADRQKAYALAKEIWPTMRQLDPSAAPSSALVAVLSKTKPVVTNAAMPPIIAGPHITGVVPAKPKGFWGSLWASLTGKAA